MDSILSTVKKSMPIADGDTHFDQDLIMYINSVLAVLTQLGVGPKKGFSIDDTSDTWSDFIEQDNRMNMIQTYVSNRVKIMFDPPTSSVLLDAMNRTISEMEWRIHQASEDIEDEKEENQNG